MIKIDFKKLSKLKVFLFMLIGVIIIFSLISMVITVFVYNGQFPRNDRHDTTVMASLRYEDIKDKYPRSLVSFKSGKNTLQGYLYGEENNQGLIVVSHGLGGGADSYLPQIKYFVSKGWRVFAYDATGSFDSEGKSTKGFPQALLDLDSALYYITTNSEFDNLPILLFGHSWGGYASANILHYDYEIAGVTTISAPNSAMEMIMEQGKRMMGSFINTQYPYLDFYQKALFGKAASLKAIDAINETNVPILIIHGTNDEVITYDGSSIISKIELITNKNVKTLSLDGERRNGHDNLFRSIAAINYIDEINVIYRGLYNKHKENIPYEIKQEFYADINRDLAQDLNDDLMNEINDFFLTSIEKNSLKR